MKHAWKIMSKPFDQLIGALPYGHIILAIAYTTVALVLNGVFIYSLYSGNMIGRRSWAPVEGRESAPVLYWIYITGYGLGVLLLDLWIIYSIPKNKK
jgi:hypothetical protein